jgi:hypothetical protein
MIAIRVNPFRGVPDDNVLALVNAVASLQKEYPNSLNVNGEFDKAFERKHNVRVITGPPCVVIWDNDADYTKFLLEWS